RREIKSVRPAESFFRHKSLNCISNCQNACLSGCFRQVLCRYIRKQEVNEKTGFGQKMPTLYLQSIASIRQLVLNKSFAFMSESRVAETP
ncbi:MAG: hypothetical protein J6J58_05880, partial [Oscillospiraceae bacterium]|nr:hypothetical protein [Oscillospiraceae bacterium]